jgi:hypothetical protein
VTARSVRCSLPVTLMCLVMALGMLTGCAEDETPASTIVVSDVSISGLSTGARLDALAKDLSVSLVDELVPGGTVEVYAFGRSLTSACAPVVADFADQDNSEEQDQLKINLRASIALSYDDLVACVRSNTAGGSPEPGSPIFGAIVEALVHARANGDVDVIELVTDGCSAGEGVPTCGKNMLDPGFADEVVEKMPASLKPDLSGIALVITGLGQGTGASSEQVSAIRAVFTAYAAATGATLSIR